MSLEPFEKVVTREGPVVWRVCRALLGEADAEDAWSETFLAALRAYPGFDPAGNLRGWLVTIAHRKAIDQIRAAGRRARPHDTLPERAERPTPDRDDQLWSAVRSLAPKQRATVTYRYLADLSYPAIAELLGISEQAARRNAADGIAALRRNQHLLASSEPSEPNATSETDERSERSETRTR